MFSAMSLVLVALLALLGQGSRAILIPPPDPNTHEYKVAVTHFSFVDVNHPDPYYEAEDRKTMLSLFMPVNKASCWNETQTPYMTPDAAHVANEQFLLNNTSDVFEKMSYTVCSGSNSSINASNHSVVILEPHVDTSRLLYTNLALHMSANGVAVVLIDHPGDASVVQFQYSATIYNSGTVPLSNFSPINPWNETVTKAVDARIQDINFALANINSLGFLTRQLPSLHFTAPLNTSSYAIVGHGLGGTVATSLSFSDARVLFSINMSGTPPLLNTTSSAPVYFFGRAGFRREHDIHWPTTWKHLTGPATEFDLQDAGIFDFSDLPGIVEVAKSEGGLEGVRGQGLGMNGSRANGAVECFVEGVIRKELFGHGTALSRCVRMFPGMVPYPGGVGRNSTVV